MPIHQNSFVNKLSASRLAYFDTKTTESKLTPKSNATQYELHRIAENKPVTSNIVRFGTPSQHLVKRVNTRTNRHLENRRSCPTLGFSVRTITAKAIANFDRRERILGISSESLTSIPMQRSNSNKTTNRNSIIMGLSHPDLLKIFEPVSTEKH